MTNILNSLDGSVWAIQESKMHEILSFINDVSADRALDMQQNIINPSDAEDDEEDKNFRQLGSTAVVKVHGTIAKRMNMMMRFSGGTSTEILGKTIRGLKDNDDIESVVLDIDSPGGSVRGLTEVAKAIRSLRQEKEVIAVANELMASAAYFIGSAADFIYATPNATVGSIGTLAVLRDQTKKIEDAGMKFKVVRSTHKKAINHPVEPIREEGVEEVERLVQEHNQEFIRNITLNRKIDMSEAKEMADGRVFVGAEAVEEGLVDGLATIDEVLEDLGDQEDASERAELFKAALTETRETFAAYEASAQEVIKELREENDELRAQLDEVKEAQLSEKVDAKVDELIENGKILPTKAEAVRDRLEDDFEGTSAMFDAVPSGTASPSEVEEASDEPEEEGTLEARIAQARDEGKAIAHDEDQAEVFENMDVDYFAAYKHE